jgi:O-antigen/teichoic acid export membrane protein
MASEVQSIYAENSEEVRGRPFRMLSRIANLAPEGALARAAPGLPIVLNQLFNSAANFVATILLLRLLGLSEFGHYTLYYVVSLSVIAVLAALVTSPTVSIAATLDPERRREALTAAGTLVVSGVAVIVVLLMWIAWLSDGAGLHLMPFAAMFAAVALSEQARRFMLFSRALVLVWCFDLLRFGLLVGVLAFSLGTERDAEFAMLAIAAAFAPALAAAAVLLIVKRSVLSFAGFRSHARRVLATGRWLSISAVLEFVTANSFLLAGSIVLGNEAVGIVRACSAIIGLVHPLILSLEHIFPREIGRLVADHGWSRGLRRYHGAAVRTGAALAAVFASLVFLAEPLLSILAGADMSHHAWVLQGLVFAWVPYVVASFIVLPLRAMERTRAVAASLAISAAAAAIIAVPLVSLFGIGGIVAGTVLIALLNTTILIAAYMHIRRQEIFA